MFILGVHWLRVTIPNSSNPLFWVHYTMCFLCKAEVNIALADLLYEGNVDTDAGEDIVTVKSSDGSLHGAASSTVSISWPTDSPSSPPTLTFRSPMVEILEDESFPLGPVRIRFGNGLSVVRGSVRCSAGELIMGEVAKDGSKSVVIEEGEEGGTSVTLRGLPGDVATALSPVEYRPDVDWNSMTNGVATLTIVVQPVGIGEVRHR